MVRYGYEGFAVGRDTPLSGGRNLRDDGVEGLDRERRMGQEGEASYNRSVLGEVGERCEERNGWCLRCGLGDGGCDRREFWRGRWFGKGFLRRGYGRSRGFEVGNGLLGGGDGEGGRILVVGLRRLVGLMWMLRLGGGKCRLLMMRLREGGEGIGLIVLSGVGAQVSFRGGRWEG